MAEKDKAVSGNDLKQKLKSNLDKTDAQAQNDKPYSATSEFAPIDDSQSDVDNPYAEMSVEQLLDMFLSDDDRATLENVRDLQQQISEVIHPQNEITAFKIGGVPKSIEQSRGSIEEAIDLSAIHKLTHSSQNEEGEEDDEEDSHNFAQRIEMLSKEVRNISGDKDEQSDVDESEDEIRVPHPPKAVEEVDDLDDRAIAEIIGAFDEPEQTEESKDDDQQEKDINSFFETVENPEPKKSNVFGFFRHLFNHSPKTAEDENVQRDILVTDTELVKDSDIDASLNNADDADTKVMEALTDEQIKEAVNKAESDKEAPVQNEEASDTETQQTVEKENTQDDTDLKLMMAFDMQDELKKLADSEKLDEIEKDIDADSIDDKELSKEKGKSVLNRILSVIKNVAADKKHEEFTSPAQIKENFAEYKLSYALLLLKIGAVALLLIFAFFFENLSIFGGALPDALNMEYFPVVHCMLDLQMVILASLVVYKEIIRGVNALIKMEPIPSSITAIAVALTVVFDLLTCFAGLKSNLRLYGFAVIFCILIMLVSEYYDMRREIKCFNIIASKRPKYAVKISESDGSALEREVFSDAIPEDATVFHVAKTKFIDGFYRRIESGAKSTKLLKIAVPATVAVAVLFFIIGLIYTKAFYPALSQGYVSALFIMPVSMFISYSYPFYSAQMEAGKNGSCIIGQESIDCYSNANIVSFDDKEVFPSNMVKLRSVKVYGDNRIDLIVYNTASVFIKVGGPLAEALAIATHDVGHSDNVEILRVESNGIEAMVDGQHLFVGKAAFIRANGITIPSSENSADEDGSGEISVMYVVIDKMLAAKIFVQYVIDPDFESLLKQLYKCGICTAIKTYDPNINDQMLSTRVKISKYPVKVIRVCPEDEKKEQYDRIDSGIVSKKNAKSMLQTISLCPRITNAAKNNVIVKIFAMAVSVIISLIVMLLGSSTAVPSFYVALYQLLWVVPIIFVTKANIGKF